MLREFKEVRQIPDEGFRRWFTDDSFDLYVWYSDSSMHTITGFQLCYQKKTHQKALTWNKGTGFIHTGIDDGEGSPLKNRTPILVADGIFAKHEVLEDFRNAARLIDPELLRFIVATVETFPGD